MAKAKKVNDKSEPPKTVQNFPIIGIGASAGGLDAFKSLLKAIPEDSGMAYVLVQHLDPTHESILPEILQRITKIPVLEITDDIPLAPNHIYVIPSNKMLLSTDGILKLSNREKKINLSIDVFFTSLAEVHKEFAVGVVLSGTGTDGTLGLKAIKEHGGISIAQDTESAGFDGMPQSAINAGDVDFILSPEKIPEQLLHINSTYRSTHIFKEVEELPKDDEAIFKQILSLLRQRSGVDFTYYKQPTFHRRIARRIAITKNKNLSGYLKFLRTDKAEQDALFQDVLIPVTSFFRDPKAFQFLTSTVFPALLNNKSQDKLIRIWVAGCSTGEEAYSIAICLHEYLALSKKEGTKIQIFASDISENSIKKARHGIFTKTEVEKLPLERIKNYFKKNNGGYEVNKLIRDLCVFAPHNFLKDPPFAKMDLISCRNVLIYMDTFLQKKALTTFHYALKENGFLMLGKSESTSNVSELFAVANQHEKIYSRKQLPGRFMHVTTERKEEALALKSQKVTNDQATQTDFRKSAEAMLLSKFTPASVVVNEQMDIVHIHGSISPFLEAPQGKPTFNLLKMAHEGLAFELRNALHKAKLREVAIIKEGIPMKLNGKQFLVGIEIVPLTDTVELHYLILFTKTSLPIAEEKTKPTTSRKINDVQKQNEQLEKELAHTREDMRSVTEDMEASNEELQSANEELQSSNEEMQSLNEEMETSKEELQSTNEELTIVNQELLDKQEQLNAARLYSDSIVSTIRHPLIVLDKSLRIKSANPSFYKKFNTVEDDIEGKLFYEIQNNQWDDQLMRSMLEKILPKNKRLDDFEIILKFPSIGERTLCLNAMQIVNEKNSEQLILLAIEDITDRVRSEKILKSSEARSRAFVESNVVAVCFTRMNNATVFEANNAFLNLLGYTREDLISGNINWLKYTPPEHHINDYDAIEKAKSMKVSPPYEKEILRKDGKRISIIKARAIINKDEIMSVFVDITERKLTEQKLIAFSEELIEAKVIAEMATVFAEDEKTKAETATEIAEHALMAKQQFLSNMSHEIRTPMNAIIGFTKVLIKTDLNEKQSEYLEAIKSSGDTLIVLINDILDLAKVNAGKMTFINSPFNIIESINTILHLFETKIQESNLGLVKEYAARIPKILLGDSVRLHQILINLLSNAIKFTVKGKITVSVNILKEDDDKVTLEIKVADTGIGIPSDKIANIFKNFEQAYTVTSSLYGGTGLGLAIVKQLVERQGGTISVKSKIDEGSTFSFILSFQKTNDVVVLENRTEQFETEIKPVNVLVVEDVKLNQLLMRTLLDDFKFNWDIADNGKIAIEKLESNSYDIILMDLQMPIMNGFEATEHIRRTMHLQIPIIALTADVTTVDLEKCKALGMNDYVSKPVDEKLLYSKILSLVKPK